jgi:hypothetical protein
MASDEQSNNSYIIDAENPAEMARLIQFDAHLATWRDSALDGGTHDE